MTAYGITDVTDANYTNKIVGVTANRADISEKNPLVLDLGNSAKYDYVKLYLTGTQFNYVQSAEMTIYPR